MTALGSLIPFRTQTPHDFCRLGEQAGTCNAILQPDSILFLPHPPSPRILNALVHFVIALNVGRGNRRTIEFKTSGTEARVDNIHLPPYQSLMELIHLLKRLM